MKSIQKGTISNKIHFIRGHRVMLDTDLAELYDVPAKRLNEQVKRNKARFPYDFMFQLTQEEHEILRSQIATLKQGHGKHRKYNPYVFTEHGIAMLSSVLNSERAIQVNIEIVRAFIHIREWMSGNRALAKKLEELEEKYDEQFKVVFDAIHEIISPILNDDHRKVGFKW